MPKPSWTTTVPSNLGSKMRLYWRGEEATLARWAFLSLNTSKAPTLARQSRRNRGGSHKPKTHRNFTGGERKQHWPGAPPVPEHQQSTHTRPPIQVQSRGLPTNQNTTFTGGKRKNQRPTNTPTSWTPAKYPHLPTSPGASTSPGAIKGAAHKRIKTQETHLYRWEEEAPQSRWHSFPRTPVKYLHSRASEWGYLLLKPKCQSLHGSEMFPRQINAYSAQTKTCFIKSFIIQNATLPSWREPNHVSQIIHKSIQRQ